MEKKRQQRSILGERMITSKLEAMQLKDLIASFAGPSNDPIQATRFAKRYLASFNFYFAQYNY